MRFGNKVHLAGRQAVWLFCLLLGAQASTAFAGPITIDDFSTPTPVTKADVYVIGLIDTNPKTLTYVGPGILNNSPSVLLGERKLTVGVVTTPVGFIDATGTIGGGSYVFGTAASAAATAALVYSAPAGSPLGGRDLTAGGVNKGMDFSFDSLDTAAANTMQYKVTASGPSGSVSAVGAFARLIAPGSYFVPFTNFLPVSGTFSFSAVDKLQIDFNTTNVRDVDFKLTGIITNIPEPPAWVLGLLSGLGLLGYVRRAFPTATCR